MVFDEAEDSPIISPRDARETITTIRHGVWHPPQRLEKFLPKGFSIPIDRVTGSDGLRRFVTRCGLDELIDLTAVGGLAVMQGLPDRLIGPDVVYSYRMMHLIFRYVRGRSFVGNHGVKAHLTREFIYSRDLYIRSAGRPDAGTWDVLPENIGQTAQGEGQRRSVAYLTTRGREAAREAGIDNPTNDQAIPFGLLEAARLNPLVADPPEILSLIRLALFDIESSQGEPEPALLEAVTERLLTAIFRHLGDAEERFQEWFSGADSSLIKQIAQQKKRPGGELDRGQVRAALLHLGWQSYLYVGQCVYALMRTIGNSITAPLNEDEKLLFSCMYESQPNYGDLPLALLAERMGFLRPAILAIWNEPKNPKHVPVLHRLIQYYSEIASKRRQADNRSKQRCSGNKDKAQNSDSEPIRLPDAELGPSADDDEMFRDDGEADSTISGESDVIETAHARARSPDDPFLRVAAHIRELKGIECRRGCTYWDCRRKGDSDDPVTLSFACECGDVANEIEMSMAEFAIIARAVLV